MRSRHLLRGAIGVAAGLTLALAVAAAPASAAKPTPAAPITSSYSCATFEGLQLTQQDVSFSGVALQAGESITATVSPVTEYQILLTAAVGLNLYFNSAPSADGITFSAPGSSVYSLNWQLATNGAPAPALTWTFDCSSATGGTGGAAAPLDSDKDGVADAADFCSGTVLPDAIAKAAAGSYYATKSGAFIDGAGKTAGITVADTGGCSATQIAAGTGLSKGAAKAGVPLATLQSWAASH